MNRKEDPIAVEFRRRLKEVEGSRPEVLGAMLDVQVGLGALLQHEVLRLEKKLGATDPRVHRTREGMKAQRRRLDVVEERRQLAQLPVPQEEEGTAAVYGRVMDSTDALGIPGLEIRLVDRQGRPIPGIEPSRTSHSGAYQIRVGRETAARPEQPPVAHVGVISRKRRLIHRDDKPLALAPGTVHRLDIALDRGELLDRVPPKPPEARPKRKLRTEKPSKAAPVPALEDLHGIGPALAEKLRRAGIDTVAAVAAADEETLGDLLRGVDIKKLKKEAERLRQKRR